MLLTVITVNLNNASGLEKTLTSLNNQTYKDFELIIIDGDSTDNSVEIINDFASIISKFKKEKDKGIYDAQNKGIKLAKGEYLLFLNSGDYLFDEFVLDKFVNFKNKRDLTVGNVIFEYPNGIKWERKLPKKLDSKFFFLESLPHPCTFINSKLFKSVGLYDLDFKIAADYDFFLRAIYKFNALISELNFPVAVFSTSGISSDKMNKNLLLYERKKSLNLYLGESEFNKLLSKSLVLDLIYKKIPYLYNFILSYNRLNK